MRPDPQASRGAGDAPETSKGPRGRLVVRCPECGAKNRVDLERAAASVPRCARCKSALRLPTPQTSPLVVDAATFTGIVEDSPIPVLLVVESRYCVYCQRLKPVIERLTPDIGLRLRVATLDMDENRALAARYRVTATPTLLVLDRGRETDRIEGAVTEDQLRYRLYRYLTPAT